MQRVPVRPGDRDQEPCPVDRPARPVAGVDADHARRGVRRGQHLANLFAGGGFGQGRGGPEEVADALRGRHARRDPLARQQRGRGAGGGRRGQEIPLRDPDAEVAGGVELFAGLDAGGDQARARPRGVVQQGLDHGHRGRVVGQPAQHAAVDLDQVDRCLDEQGEREVAAAEPVECQPEAELRKRAHAVEGTLRGHL